MGARPVPPSGARTVGTVSGWVSQRFEDRGWAGLGGGRNLVELPSPTFLKGPARAGAGQRWPHPVCVRPEQGLTLVARRRGWALLVATVPYGLRARRQPLHSPLRPSRPSRSSLPPSLPVLFPPSCSPSPPSLPSLSTAEAPTPEGTEADAGSSNRRRQGTAGPGVASSWPRRERGPSCWDPSGEWGHGPTVSPKACMLRDPAPLLRRPARY